MLKHNFLRIPKNESDCYYSKSGCSNTAQIIRDLLSENRRMREALEKRRVRSTPPTSMITEIYEISTKALED